MRRVLALLRRARIGTAVLALAVALAAALAVLPARWLLRLAPSDLPLAIVDASGTLWHGSAWIALGSPEARRMLTEPVQWRWRGLSVELSHPWLRGPIILAPRWNGLSVSGQQALLPAAALAGLGTPWNTVAPGGQLELRWQAFSTTGPPPRGTLAEASWRGASSALSPLAPMGDYRLRVEGAGRGARILLSTDKGVLRLDGQGEWTGRRLTFNGRARAADDATDTQRAALSGLLNAIGPLRDGGHAFGTG